MINFLGRDGFIWWIGVVEDIEDPIKLGRCRVRIFGYHPPLKENLVPTDHLPWSTIIVSPNMSAKTPPKLGDWVIGFFLDSDTMQEPAVFGLFQSEPKESGEYFSLPPSKFQKETKGSEVTHENKLGIENFKPYYALEIESDNNDGRIHGHSMIMYNEPDKGVLALKSSLGHSIKFDDNDLNSYLSVSTKDNRHIEINDTNEFIEIKSLNHEILINDKLNTISIKHFTGASFSIDALGNITIKPALDKDLNLIAKNVNINADDNFTVNAKTVMLSGTSLTISDAGNSYTPTSLKNEQNAQDTEIGVAKTLPEPP